MICAASVSCASCRAKPSPMRCLAGIASLSSYSQTLQTASFALSIEKLALDAALTAQLVVSVANLRILFSFAPPMICLTADDLPFASRHFR